METAKQHWEILRRVPEEFTNRVRAFMVIGEKGYGVLLVTEDGKGYWFGEMKFGWKSKQALEPIRLDVPNLVSMAQGYNHILLLGENGQIYTMGKNYCGQLGLGTADKKICFLPERISIPHKFISIRCGRWHSLALTKDGNVWAWGDNNYGQVGVPSSTDFLPSPGQISKLDLHRVAAVECGGDHSLALTDQGEVYSWGRNDCGQLGVRRNLFIPSNSFFHTPTQISIPSPVKSIGAGQNHTLLLTQTGEVYACGSNEYGQLGLPTATKFSCHLVKIASLPSISQIASHFDTSLSIAMSDEQECFAWGRLSYTTTFSPLQLPPIYSTLDSVLSFQTNTCNTPCSVRVEGLRCSRGTYPETQIKLLTGPNRLWKRISRMFDNPDSNPDVKFELGEQVIMAHRNVLQVSSAHFAQLFSESSTSVNLKPPTSIAIRHSTIPFKPDLQFIPISPLKTISIFDHSYTTFYSYIHYLYTGTFQVSNEHLTDLFDLARFYLESDLEQLCLSRMRSTLSPKNCCLFYQLIDRHPLPEFEQELLYFIAENHLQVFSTEAYQSLDEDLCKKLGVSIGNLRRKLLNEN